MPLTVGLEAINNPTGEVVELFPKNTPQRLKKARNRIERFGNQRNKHYAKRGKGKWPILQLSIFHLTSLLTAVLLVPSQFFV